MFIKDSSGMLGHREAQLRMGRGVFEGGWRGTHLDTRLGLITGRKASTQEFHSRAPVSVWNIIPTEVNLVLFIP